MKKTAKPIETKKEAIRDKKAGVKENKIESKEYAVKKFFAKRGK